MQHSLGLVVQQEGLLVTLYGRRENVDFNRFEQISQTFEVHYGQKKKGKLTLYSKKANVNAIF